MAQIPDAFLDLLQQKKAYANLATVLADGSPQVTPVWFDYSAGKIRFNTAKGRVKARVLKQGSPVALAILDPDNPYRYIQIRGRVSQVTTDPNVADPHINALTKKYLDKDVYPFRRAGEERVMYEVEPTSVQTMAA